MKTAVIALLFAGAAYAQGPSADYVPAAAAYYYNGTNWTAFTTTGTAGPAADNQPAIGLWGYNASTGRWYPCGPSNACTGAGGGGGGGVTTFNGRSGAVSPATNDYSATQINGFNTAAAAAAPVQSVYGRTGAVIAASGDVPANFITSGTLPLAVTPAYTGNVTKAAGSGTTVLANITNGTPVLYSGNSAMSLGLASTFDVRLASDMAIGWSNTATSSNGGSVASADLNIARCDIGLLCINTNDHFNSLARVKEGQIVLTPDNVPFSTTPSFSPNTQYSRITLTANVTSSSIPVATDGAMKTILICQDSTGGRTFVWPTNMKGTGTIGSTANTCSSQSFIYNNVSGYQFYYATGPILINQ